jgi:hypothetical protein
VLVPAGTKPTIINTGTVPLRLYTLYAPPNHRDGVVHTTRADAEADHEHFDGKTTEQRAHTGCSSTGSARAASWSVQCGTAPLLRIRDTADSQCASLAKE